MHTVILELVATSMCLCNHPKYIETCLCIFGVNTKKHNGDTIPLIVYSHGAMCGMMKVKMASGQTSPGPATNMIIAAVVAQMRSTSVKTSRMAGRNAGSITILLLNCSMIINWSIPGFEKISKF